MIGLPVDPGASLRGQLKTNKERRGPQLWRLTEWDLSLRRAHSR
jgi:hypothetical protein